MAIKNENKSPNIAPPMRAVTVCVLISPCSRKVGLKRTYPNSSYIRISFEVAHGYIAERGNSTCCAVEFDGAIRCLGARVPHGGFRGRGRKARYVQYCPGNERTSVRVSLGPLQPFMNLHLCSKAHRPLKIHEPNAQLSLVS